MSENRFNCFYLTQRAVEMLRARYAGKLVCVFDPQAATDRNLDSARRLLYQPSERCCTGNYVLFAACCEDTFATSRDRIFERLLERKRVVEGAIEGDLQGCGQVYQLSRPLNINGCVCMQDPQHNSAHAHRFEVKQVLFHDGEFCIRILKIARPRPHQDMDRQFAEIEHNSHQAVAGRQTIFYQRRAQLDPVRPTLLPSDACLNTLGTQLKNDFTLH